jgi:hypothetical protein
MVWTRINGLLFSRVCGQFFGIPTKKKVKLTADSRVHLQHLAPTLGSKPVRVSHAKLCSVSLKQLKKQESWPLIFQSTKTTPHIRIGPWLIPEHIQLFQVSRVISLFKSNEKLQIPCEGRRLLLICLGERFAKDMYGLFLVCHCVCLPQDRSIDEGVLPICRVQFKETCQPMPLQEQVSLSSRCTLFFFTCLDQDMCRKGNPKTDRHMHVLVQGRMNSFDATFPS